MNGNFSDELNLNTTWNVKRSTYIEVRSQSMEHHSQSRKHSTYLFSPIKHEKDVSHNFLRDRETGESELGGGSSRTPFMGDVPVSLRFSNRSPKYRSLFSELSSMPSPRSHPYTRLKDQIHLSDKHYKDIKHDLQLCTQRCCIEESIASRLSSVSSDSACSTGSSINESLARTVCDCRDCTTRSLCFRLLRNRKYNGDYERDRNSSPDDAVSDNECTLSRLTCPSKVSPLRMRGISTKRVSNTSQSDLCPCPQCLVGRESLRREYVRRNTIESPPSRTSTSPSNLQLENYDQHYVIGSQRTLTPKRYKTYSSSADLPPRFHKEKNQMMTSTLRAKSKALPNESVTDMESAAVPNRSRVIANLLERRRVAELNTAFDTLRDAVPNYGNEDRNLSKIKTLRYAMTYIVHLMSILDHLKEDGSKEGKPNVILEADPMFKHSHEHMKKRKVLS